MVAPVQIHLDLLFHRPPPVVKEVLFGSVVPRPSLVVLERREGSVNMYLIKAAWEFH